jgi:hypothetical protein
VVEASAPGYLPFRQAFRVVEEQTTNVLVKLEVAPIDPSAQTSAGGRADASSGTTRTLGWVVGGVGAASLAASGVFFYLRGQAIDDLDNGCGSDREGCPNSLKDTEEKGRLYTTLTSVTLAAGAVGVAVGVTLILTSKSAPRSALVLSPTAPGALAGAQVLGRF